jgi:hypothetical protein
MHAKDGKGKLTKKQKQQLLNMGLMDIEVYDRVYDEEVNQFLDQKTNISGSKFGTKYNEQAYK